MPDSTQNSLFGDISPERPREPQRGGARPKREAASHRSPSLNRSTPTEDQDDDGSQVGFMGAVDGHYECDRCGTTLLDLVAIVRKPGHATQWRICCGWWCLHSWLVPPIPGWVEKQEKKEPVFRVRDGRFDGLTFDEIRDSGNEWYMVMSARMAKRSTLRDAARKWLDTSGSLDTLTVVR